MIKWEIDQVGMNALLTLPEPGEILQAIWDLDVEEKTTDEVYDGLQLETMTIINLLADHIVKVETNV